jgi:hypothetical protein
VSLANTVAKLSRPVEVTRRGLTTFGQDGRPVADTTEVVEVRLSIQPYKGDDLVRTAQGDDSTGRIVVHVTDSALAAAGWTELQLAPPQDADGPPGDLIPYQGRQYEIVQRNMWQLEGFSGPSKFQRYEAEERGAAP